MFKYLKINSILWRNSYIRDSRIPFHVISVLLFHVVEAAVTVIFFNVLFAHTGDLDGWNFYQVLFLYAFAEAIVRFHSAWTKQGVRALAGETIRRGDLDFYLTKPVDAMLLVSISKPRVFDLITVFFHIGLAVYALSMSGVQIHTLNVLWFIFLAGFGICLFYFLQILTVIPVFWLIRTYALVYIMNRLSQYMRYPAGVFSPILRTSLFIIFPVMAVAYIPAQTLFYPPKLGYIIYMVAITLAFGVITRLLWRMGTKRYGSASS